MNKFGMTIILFVIPLIFLNCQREQPSQLSLFAPDNQYIQYTGRIDFTNPKRPRLSGAGTYFQVKFKGSTCDILLEDQNLYNNHNYLSIAIDGIYRGRIKVSKDKTKYQIANNLTDSDHNLLVCKATESQIGYVEFLGILCNEILPLEKKKKRKIEFIGNSITCGMGLDTSDIPCDSADWYDQHNAYLAYGPLLSQELNADWLLSSVSGIGIARNWNSPGPTMPEVYQHMYLNTDSTSLWDDHTFIPDLVSICLGTNDFSDGDGTYVREALDSTKFVNDYIRFIRRIRKRYPQAQICCLTSPMLSGEKSVQLTDYLSTVMHHMKKVEYDNKIQMFIFSRSYTNGCTDHPDKADHQMMVKELLPIFRRVMNWK